MRRTKGADKDPKDPRGIFLLSRPSRLREEGVVRDKLSENSWRGGFPLSPARVLPATCKVQSRFCGVDGLGLRSRVSGEQARQAVCLGQAA